MRDNPQREESLTSPYCRCCHKQIYNIFWRSDAGSGYPLFVSHVYIFTEPTRVEAEFAHRLRVVRAKLHKHRETLINKHVFWKLRLKYFNAMISPTILFGLSSLPLTKLHFQKLNVVSAGCFGQVWGGLLWKRMTGETQWNAWMTDYSRLCHYTK